MGSVECTVSFCPASPSLTLILLTWRIWRAPNNASRWQMGFNSALKGLIYSLTKMANYDALNYTHSF